MTDLQEVNTVEISVDQTGKLWINIDGKCALRIGHCAEVKFEGMEFAKHVDDDSNQVTLTW
jgi:hypothetical protein